MKDIEKKIQYVNELTSGVIQVKSFKGDMKALKCSSNAIGKSKLKNASRNYKKKEIEKNINK